MSDMRNNPNKKDFFRNRHKSLVLGASL
jgi:hypothetical protein